MANANEQVNQSREDINNRITKLSYMGVGASKYWRSKRRFRTI